MPIVAMTREMGSLGKDVAAEVSARMGRPLVHHEIIDHLADKMRLRKSHVVRYLDGTAGLWERMTTDRTSLAIYTADELCQVVEQEAAGVIRGWGAAHLFRPIRHVISVRVCAPFERRVERMMERLGTDERRAVENEIRLSDEAHAAITRRHFGINWTEPEHYDLVLNTDRVPVVECANEILSLVQDAAFAETAESMQAFADLSLQTRVRAALRADPRTAGQQVSVAARNGVVSLTGIVATSDQVLACREVAAAVPGLKRVIETLLLAQAPRRLLDG